MGREFSLILPDTRFQIVGMNAMIRPRKEPAMAPANDELGHIEDEAETSVRSPCISSWLWRPWYAKLWWGSIPPYWLGMASSTKFETLERFYDSALAGYLNILFFPMTALLVLGIGYEQRWLASLSIKADGDGPALQLISHPDPWGDEIGGRSFGKPHPSVDIYDPRSGALYVGNPISPNNGARINVS